MELSFYYINKKKFQSIKMGIDSDESIFLYIYMQKINKIKGELKWRLPIIRLII